MAKIFHLAVVLLVVAAHIMVEQGEASICGELSVRRAGVVCNAFYVGDQAEPSAECCNMYRATRARVKTKAERREYCSCGQQLVYQYPDAAARIPRIDSIPEKCRIPFLYSVDPNFDCNTIN